MEWRYARGEPVLHCHEDVKMHPVATTPFTLRSSYAQSIYAVHLRSPYTHCCLIPLGVTLHV